MKPRLLAFGAMVLSGASLLDAGASNGPRLATVTAGPSRTPWGDQDLQGVWSGLESIGVPFDRDPALGTRNLLTEEEFQARQKALRVGTSGDNIETTNFGRGGAEAEVLRNESRQASLVVDPPGGRRPPRTAESDARQPTFGSFSAGPFNSVNDLGVFDRCVAFAPVSAASPFNTLQIVQAPGYVALRSEVIHETRIVPLDGRSHVSPRLKMYGGDSRGRWEGRTLVVTTTNFNGLTSLQGNAGGRPSERLTVVERFTLVDSNTLLYEATFDDPETWTQSWTVRFPRKRDVSGAVYEYACHEGNYGVTNILSGARATD
jgi:hypothetical protein